MDYFRIGFEVGIGFLSAVSLFSIVSAVSAYIVGVYGRQIVKWIRGFFGFLYAVLKWFVT